MKRFVASSTSIFTMSPMISWAILTFVALTSMRALVNSGGRMILFDIDSLTVESVLVLPGWTWFLIMFLMSRSCNSDFY